MAGTTLRIPLRNYPKLSKKFIAALTCFGFLFLGFTFSISFLLTSTLVIISVLYFSRISKANNSLPFHRFLQQEEAKEVIFTYSSASAPTTGDLLLSDAECAGDNFTTTEESEVGWPFFHRCPDRSDDDGSISDEESLIEIALPTGHYVVGHKFDYDDDDDDMSFHLQKLSDFEKQKKNFEELLAEINDINEEENLIEIDISMGSIKYSRFEIEA